MSSRLVDKSNGQTWFVVNSDLTLKIIKNSLGGGGGGVGTLGGGVSPVPPFLDETLIIMLIIYWLLFS